MTTKSSYGFTDRFGRPYALSVGDVLRVIPAGAGILVGVVARDTSVLVWHGGDDKLLIEVAPTAEGLQSIATTLVRVVSHFTGLDFRRAPETERDGELHFVAIEPETRPAGN